MEVAIAGGVAGGVVVLCAAVYACRRCCSRNASGYSLVSHELDREELDFKRALESQCGAVPCGRCLGARRGGRPIFGGSGRGGGRRESPHREVSPRSKRRRRS